MLSLDPTPFQQSLADFCTRQTGDLARTSVCVSMPDTTGFAPWALPLLHRDHTPSLSGQRVKPSALLPDFSKCRGKEETQATKRKPGITRVVRQLDKSSEGTGICLFGTSFWGSQPARPLRHVATPSVNRPLAAVPSVRVPQRSPAAALSKVLPSVQRATSLIASLTPANVAATDPARNHPRLKTRPNLGSRRHDSCAAFGHFHSHIAHRAAPAVAVLRVSLKTQKDTPCSRKS